MTWPCERCEAAMDVQFAYTRKLTAEVERLRALCIRARALVPYAVDVPRMELEAEQWLQDTLGMPTPVSQSDAPKTPSAQPE